MRTPLLVLAVIATAGLTTTPARAATPHHKTATRSTVSVLADASLSRPSMMVVAKSLPSRPDEPAPAAEHLLQCPAPPARVLRDGSAAFGFVRLCRDSMAQAATPQAAAAIRFVLAHLNQPYSQRRRNDANWFDCSSYMSRAYQDAGVPLAPPHHNASTTWMLLDLRGKALQVVSYRDARPGDLIFPKKGHVGMVLAHHYMAHTNRAGDVSHIRRLYSAGSTYTVLRVRS